MPKKRGKSLVGYIQSFPEIERYIRKLIITRKKYMPDDIKVRITIEEI